MGYNLYTDLDTIFDTRYELLKTINAAETKKILLNKSYHTRLVERYGNITWDIFKPLWDKRTKPLLVYAPRTSMLDIIKEQYLQCVTDPSYTDVLDKLTLYVNTHPYNLTEQEKKDIETGIAYMIPNCRILCIDKSFKELTSNWIVENVGYLFMYEFLDWVDYQFSTGVYNLKLNRIEAFAPGVTRLEDNVSITNKDIMDMEEKYKMFVNLYLIDVEYFCCKMIKLDLKKE